MSSSEDDSQAKSKSSQDSQKIDFLKDKPAEMSRSRRLALHLMKKMPGYLPPKKDEESKERAVIPEEARRQFEELGDFRSQDAYPMSHSVSETPSLEKAWAYRDHVVLPRYLVDTDAAQKKMLKKKKKGVARVVSKFSKGNRQLERAEPGEVHLPTKLYDPFFTPHKQLGDWGLGIGLYFTVIRGVMFLTLLAGVVNIPSISFYQADDYDSTEQAGVTSLLKGSAICTDRKWVPCPDCRETDYSTTSFRYGYQDGTNMTIPFVNKNFCNGGTIKQGMLNYATMFLLMAGLVLIKIYMDRMEVAFDEDEQTAQDYSVVIQNPPADATDPEEWRAFFMEKFGAQVTVVTVAVDNDLLVRALVRRRELMRMIELRVEPGTSMDMITIARIAGKEESNRTLFDKIKTFVSPGIPELFSELLVMTGKVQGLIQEDHPASDIFVTFERESDQRRVLAAFNVGAIDIWKNNKAAIDQKYLFRGEHVLEVTEPEEPDTIRWQDLNASVKDKAIQQAVTFTIILGVLVADIVIINKVNNAARSMAPLMIAIFDNIFPFLARFLVSFEFHPTEGDRQTSLYLKLSLFRLVNTALIISLITPFDATLMEGKDGMIQQVYAIFWSDIVTSNVLQIGDPFGHLQRHILAPRELTQDAMNLKMQGTPIDLADLYTNVTKMIFLAIWYSALFPGAFFLCALALFINYVRNKFSLMRTWKRPPQLGVRVARFGQTFFPPLAIGAMAFMSSYVWASFPNDNLCPAGVAVNGSMAGKWDLFHVDHNDILGTVDAHVESERELRADEPVYRWCQQNFIKAHSFPFVPSKQPKGSEWMTDEQETVSLIYGYTCIGIIVLVIFFAAYHIWGCVKTLFHGSYESRGDDQGVNFSDVAMMNGYIPQVESPVFSYPLFACNVDNIDDSILDWTDPDRPYSFYDLTRDAEVLLRGLDVSSKVTFAQVAHWPPNGKEKAPGPNKIKRLMKVYEKKADPPASRPPPPPNPATAPSPAHRPDPAQRPPPAEQSRAPMKTFPPANQTPQGGQLVVANRPSQANQYPQQGQRNPANQPHYSSQPAEGQFIVANQPPQTNRPLQTYQPHGYEQPQAREMYPANRPLQTNQPQGYEQSQAREMYPPNRPLQTNQPQGYPQSQARQPGGPANRPPQGNQPPQARQPGPANRPPQANQYPQGRQPGPANRPQTSNQQPQTRQVPNTYRAPSSNQPSQARQVSPENQRPIAARQPGPGMQGPGPARQGGPSPGRQGTGPARQGGPGPGRQGTGPTRQGPGPMGQGQARPAGAPGPARPGQGPVRQAPTSAGQNPARPGPARQQQQQPGMRPASAGMPPGARQQPNRPGGGAPARQSAMDSSYEDPACGCIPPAIDDHRDDQY